MDGGASAGRGNHPGKGGGDRRWQSDDGALQPPAPGATGWQDTRRDPAREWHIAGREGQIESLQRALRNFLIHGGRPVLRNLMMGTGPLQHLNLPSQLAMDIPRVVSGMPAYPRGGLESDSRGGCPGTTQREFQILAGQVAEGSVVATYAVIEIPRHGCA